MIKKPAKSIARGKRHARVRKDVSGTAERPRLSVFRSDKHIYAQLINDVAGETLCSSSTMEKDVKEAVEKTWDVEAAEKVGETIGKKAVDLGIEKVVFDRGGFLYHGRVEALADAAREAGLTF